MAVAAAAAGVIAVVSLQSDRSGPLVGGAGGRSSADTPTTAPASGDSTTTTVPASGGSTTTTSPQSKSSAGVRSAVGKSEQYGYGVLATQVTVRGSQIVNVTIVTLQTDEPRSQSIADEAIPQLKREVLSAQSARINAISGATYTSEGYALSVQSALDKLHVS